MIPLACQVDLQRNRADGAAVTSVELFYDLVFVFAVTQLSHLLLSHLTWSGTVNTAVLFLPVWWAWIGTGWSTNWLDPERRPVKALLFVLMAAGLVLSAALPRAFGNRGLVFALAYVALQLGRPLFMLWALRAHDPENFRNFQRISIWAALASVIWIAGGLLPGPPRLGVWTAAVVLETAAPSLGFWTPGLGRSQADQWRVDGRHLAERCSAFVLIALGESLTVTGAAFFQTHWTPAVAGAFGAAFLGSVALWWIYFDTAAERTSRAMAQARDPGRLARGAYTYLHAVLVAGVIVWAVACQEIMVEPLAPADPAMALSALGGPALYLVGNALFRRSLAPRFPPSHGVGLALLALVFIDWRLFAVSKLWLGLDTALALALTGATGSLLLHLQERRRRFA